MEKLTYILEVKYVDGSQETRTFDSRQKCYDYVHHDHVLEYTITEEITDIQICYKTNKPCKFNCQGLCKESY